MRRPFKTPPVQRDGPRSNRDIRVSHVQLIDERGRNRGVFATNDAFALAVEVGLDLVEIVPAAEPPVCKIVDLGKLKYQNQKKASEARKKQKTVEIKEIKIRPNIDIHDYEVKIKAICRFLEDGDKVKITLRFRGREVAHQDLGIKIFNRVKEDTIALAKVEMGPKLEGRQIIMILVPR